MKKNRTMFPLRRQTKLVSYYRILVQVTTNKKQMTHNKQIEITGPSVGRGGRGPATSFPFRQQTRQGHLKQTAIA